MCGTKSHKVQETDNCIQDTALKEASDIEILKEYENSRSDNFNNQNNVMSGSMRADAKELNANVMTGHDMDSRTEFRQRLYLDERSETITRFGVHEMIKIIANTHYLSYMQSLGLLEYTRRRTPKT